tara:strand:- start:46 stop:321 length:276 start_codon:yes stop_codon:yes gene_type:complete
MSVTLSAEAIAKLDVAAKKYGVSRSNFLRMIVEQTVLSDEWNPNRLLIQIEERTSKRFEASSLDPLTESISGVRGFSEGPEIMASHESKSK